MVRPIGQTIEHGAELGGVVAEIDKLFSQGFDDLVNSLQLGTPPAWLGWLSWRYGPWVAGSSRVIRTEQSGFEGYLC